MMVVSLKCCIYVPIGNEASTEDCKTETSVVTEGGEISEFVQHKLACFVCLFCDLLLEEAVGFKMSSEN